MGRSMRGLSRDVLLVSSGAVAAQGWIRGRPARRSKVGADLRGLWQHAVVEKLRSGMDCGALPALIADGR